MIRFLIANLERRRQFITYGLIGVTGASLDYVCFILLVHFALLHYLFANAISTSLGITNNFLLNAHFNFKVSDRFWIRFASFFSIGLLGLILASGLLYAFVALLHLPTSFAKLCTVFLIAIVQYNLNKFISFRKGSDAVLK